MTKTNMSSFLIFDDRDDCELFFDFLNLQHENIKFTLEIECKDGIQFVDVHFLVY